MTKKTASSANWTMREKTQLLALLNAGQTPRQIAARMNRTVRGVRRQLSILRPDRCRIRTSWTPNQDAQLIMAINDGCQASRIAAAMNRSVAAVRGRLKWLRASGAPIKASLCRASSPSDVAHQAVGPAITPDDLAWMQRYRQSAAQRQQRSATL